MTERRMRRSTRANTELHRVSFGIPSQQKKETRALQHPSTHTDTPLAKKLDKKKNERPVVTSPFHFTLPHVYWRHSLSLAPPSFSGNAAVSVAFRFFLDCRHGTFLPHDHRTPNSILRTTQKKKKIMTRTDNAERENRNGINRGRPTRHQNRKQQVSRKNEKNARSPPQTEQPMYNLQEKSNEAEDCVRSETEEKDFVCFRASGTKTS